MHRKKTRCPGALGVFRYTLETLAPKSRVDELKEEVSVLRSVVRQHSRDIELLKARIRKPWNESFADFS